MPAATDAQSFPAGFQAEDIQTNGTTLHVRVGGQGPAVILLHGYGETGDMWAPLAADLAQDHTIVAPDAAWGSPFVPPVDTTRRHRAKMSLAFSTRSGLNG
jgi:pimeloyl-ACP methyl ester carboxylesterase